MKVAISGTLDTLAIEQFDRLKEGGIYVHSNATPLGDF